MKREWFALLLILVAPTLLAKPRYPLPKNPDEAWQNDIDLDHSITSINNVLGNLVVNVKNPPYSAVGDGVTDDSPSIQLAIDENPGAIIFLPCPATYYINADIYLRNSNTLAGCGMKQSTLIHGTGISLAVIVVQGDYNTLRDFSLDGNYPTVTGFIFSEIGFVGTNNKIDSVEVRNFTNIGIDASTNNSKVLNSYVVGVASSSIGSTQGIYTNSQSARGVEIAGNVVLDTRIEGISALGIGLDIHDNYVAGCHRQLTPTGGGQIAVYPSILSSATIKVHGNHVGSSNGSTTGIEINGSANVYGNTVTDQPNWGIVVQAGSHNKVINNVIRNCGLNGINVGANISSFTIIGNSIYDDQQSMTQDYGIFIDTGTSNYYIVSGNDLRANVVPMQDNGTGTVKFVRDNLGYNLTDIHFSTSSGGVFTPLATTAVFQNVVSTTLARGSWLLSGVCEFRENAATGTTIRMAISAFSANTLTDHVFGNNVVDQTFPTVNNDTSSSIPDFVVSVSTFTTYYLKSRATFSAGNPTVSCRMSGQVIK